VAIEMALCYPISLTYMLGRIKQSTAWVSTGGLR
jgi:hypothetical protein